MSAEVKCKLCGHEPGIRLSFSTPEEEQEFHDMYMCVKCDEDITEIINKIISND